MWRQPEPWARPYIANAQAKTAVCWLNQGFIPQEDAAMRQVCEDYMKASGNKLDYSIMPFMAMNQKTISALTSGDVPDMIFMDAPSSIMPQNAWDDKILDVSDVVAPYESQLSETAKLGLDLLQQGDEEAQLLPVPDQAGRDAVPHLGRPGREGRPQDVGDPEEVGRLWSYFKQAQKPLRAKGMRKIYACGLQITTVGPNDGNNLFAHFLIANGGEGIVTPDGKLHIDDPKVREAAIKSVEFMTNLYKEGVCRPRR